MICNNCGGSGNIMSNWPYPSTSNMNPCQICNGSGKIYSSMTNIEDCPACKNIQFSGASDWIDILFLTSEIERLQKVCGERTAETKSLRQRNKRLSKQRNKLNQENQVLRKENKELKKDYQYAFVLYTDLLDWIYEHC